MKSHDIHVICSAHVMRCASVIVNYKLQIKIAKTDSLHYMRVSLGMRRYVSLTGITRCVQANLGFT